MNNLKTLFITVIVIVGCQEKKASGLDKEGQRDISTQSSDSLDYEKTYGLTLTGEVTEALDMLDILHLVGKDSTFKSQFENRFKYKTDRTTYLSERIPL